MAKKESKKVEATKGVLALYDHPDTVLKAAEKARDQGFERWDVFTPFPVHGMDAAMGLGRSKVPWITFVMAVVGACAGFGIQVGTMVFSWPQNYGGKPHLAWPGFVPISFEMTILFAGIFTAFGALLLGRVLFPKKPKLDPSITRDRFAIYIEAKDPHFDSESTLKLLQETGAVEVRTLKEES